jgi:putative ABC transport system substrate-binding protein
MKKLSKLLAILCCTALVISLAACNTGGKKYKVGIVQLVQHEALDAATKGFKEAIEKALPGQVEFDTQNASNDSNICSTIVNSFVSAKVDLIMANATPALQAAAAATTTIPSLGTSITEYGVALDIKDFSGTVGGNISGASDLAPLDQQAAIVKEFFPDAKKVGLLYCSAEPNSLYQVTVMKAELEKLGSTAELYSFSDSNDVAAVTTTVVAESDVIYIPTDNTAATSAGIIDGIARPAGVPIITGEEGICKGCAVATLSINYYDIGYKTGEMAVKVLKGETKIAEMPIEYADNVTKKYNAEICGALGITPPAGYEAIG